MPLRSLAACLLALLGAASVELPAGRAAASILVVDTGPGGGTYSLTKDRWLAAQFTLDQAYTISRIQGWIAYTGDSFAPIPVVIYGDGGDVPNTAEVFFDQQFGIGLNPIDSDWRGPGGLALDLAAGTYWVAFEHIDYDGVGAMFPTPFQELDNYAFWTPGTGWVGDDELRIGVQIEALPEPGTEGLLAGLLLLALLGARPRLRRRAGASGKCKEISRDLSEGRGVGA